jgi:hypothetical protein
MILTPSPRPYITMNIHRHDERISADEAHKRLASYICQSETGVWWTVGVSYNGNARLFRNQTRKAALRTLGSVISGKRHLPTEYISFVVNGTTKYTWTDLRNLIEDGAL